MNKSSPMLSMVGNTASYLTSRRVLPTWKNEIQTLIRQPTISNRLETKLPGSQFIQWKVKEQSVGYADAFKGIERKERREVCFSS